MNLARNALVMGLILGFIVLLQQPAVSAQLIATPLVTISYLPDKVTLPAEFLKTDSKTTKLNDLNRSQLQNIQNLIIENVGVCKVEFKGTMDLSNDTDKLNTLGTYVKMSMVGDVSIDTTNFPALNKPATITMTGLKFSRTPHIYKDGKNADNEVTNVSYNAKTGVLVFDVSGFSEYTVVSADDEALDKNALLALAGIIVLILIGMGLSYTFKTRKVVEAEKK